MDAIVLAQASADQTVKLFCLAKSVLMMQLVKIREQSLVLLVLETAVAYALLALLEKTAKFSIAQVEQMDRSAKMEEHQTEL